MSEEIMSASSLLTANADLRAALDVALGENEGRIALERKLREERDQALVKVAGLNLAADQYSVSRDQWMLKAKAAEADAATLRRALSVLTNVGDAESARSIASKMLQRVNAGAPLLAELALLRELAADVARWRESSDARDLLYILETMDKIDAMKGGDK